MRSKSAYVLSQSPLVVAGSFGLIDDLPTGGPVTVLYHPPWWLHPVGVLRIRKKIQALQRRRPARVIICANSIEEVWFARAGGLTAYLHNQNIHAREGVFYPEEASMRYDAVYAASMEAYKRLSLTQSLESIFVLTYKSGFSSGWDLHKEYPALKKAEYNREFWGEAAVRALYSSSRCGLALSRIEGAMWATAEYLLCGLPVVSTRNFGGRNHFRNPLYWREIAAAAQAVVCAVDALKTSPPDRGEVRRVFLTKIKSGREHFARSFAPLCDPKENFDAFSERVWGSAQGIASLRSNPSEIA